MRRWLAGSLVLRLEGLVLLWRLTSWRLSWLRRVSIRLLLLVERLPLLLLLRMLRLLLLLLLWSLLRLSHPPQGDTYGGGRDRSGPVVGTFLPHLTPSPESPAMASPPVAQSLQLLTLAAELPGLGERPRAYPSQSRHWHLPGYASLALLHPGEQGLTLCSVRRGGSSIPGRPASSPPSDSQDQRQRLGHHQTCRLAGFSQGHFRPPEQAVSLSGRGCEGTTADVGSSVTT